MWVDVPSHLFDPEKGHLLYHEFLDEMEYAERAGFDGLCCGNTIIMPPRPTSSPNLIAAALTRGPRAALIVLGNSALYKPPIRGAEEFAMLDVVSGGRLVAGFPVGTSMDTNFAMARCRHAARQVLRGT